MRESVVRYVSEFEVLITNERAQAAEMVIQPGEREGGPDNVHEGSDQWLYAVKGNGRAIVGGKEIDLNPGVLILIEMGESHEIFNTGLEPLKTLNFYVPPAYSA
jgi:mannose-6-phosphate isomerase-like protein (cupin superfamily)